MVLRSTISVMHLELGALVVLLIRKFLYIVLFLILSLQSGLMKLVEWKEGGYSPRHNPPTGEVWAGGHMVAHGYYKMPEKTAEDFFKDENGIRWFKTGDIGKLDEDGSIILIGNHLHFLIS